MTEDASVDTDNDRSILHRSLSEKSDEGLDCVLPDVSEPSECLRYCSVAGSEPLRVDCRGAIGGIGKLITGGAVTCPKKAEK